MGISNSWITLANQLVWRSSWKTKASEAASVGGLCYTSFTAAFPARRRIDFAARSAGFVIVGNPVPLHARHLCSGSFADGSFADGFFIAIFQTKPSAGICSTDGFAMEGPGNVRCDQPTRSSRRRNESHSLSLIPALRVKAGTSPRRRARTSFRTPTPSRSSILNGRRRLCGHGSISLPLNRCWVAMRSGGVFQPIASALDAVDSG
jgi:hypothetical protein